MLVLSRKLGEKIVIGDNIVVTVVKLDHNQVRIGVEAPKDISVHRKEVLEAIQKDTTFAAAPVPTPPVARRKAEQEVR